MYTNEILLSANFYKSLPEGRRRQVLSKLKYFFTVYANSQNKNIHTGARLMEIRGVPGVYKLRTSRSERILYEVNEVNNIILREYSSHDNQIVRAKNMEKNIGGEIPFSSLFDKSNDEKDFERYEIEKVNESFLIIDQSEIIIATDEWISQCEDTQDYIWLASKEQAEIISSSKYPLFISGSAGTGKTTVIFQKLCGLAQNKGDILYITISPVLKDDFQRIYEKFKPKQEIARITFLTIDELYKIYMPQYSKIAKQEQFLSEFTPVCQRMNINPQDVWCEIEGIIKSHLGITRNSTISFLDQLLSSSSTTLSSKNYDSVKNKYSYFSIESRKYIYEIARKYDRWLADQNLMDINQIAAKIINSGVKRKYDIIMIDEVQDFTELQLYMLMQLARSATNVIYCGDINQNVRPTFFMFERLYNIYYSKGCKNAKENMYTLTKNYRSCKEIVVLLNRILDEQGQRIGFQGSKEDEGIHETGFRDGFSPVYLESTEENLNKILKAVCDKHYAIAVAPDEPTRNALASRFPEAAGRLFTVQEAKGLEYNVVFTVNVTSAYEKEWNRVVNNNDVKRKRRFRRFFGYIYVAASRARNHLIITEKDGSSFLKLINGTYEPLSEWGLAEVGLIEQSSAVDFYKDAGKLEKAGLTEKANEARAMADKLRKREDQEQKPAELSEGSDVATAKQLPRVQLSKKHFLKEQSGQKGVITDKEVLIIPCRYDDIYFSSYKDENGKSVFTCVLDGKITYYDQNGYLFKPGTNKPKTKKKGRKKSGAVFASVLIMAFVCITALSIIPLKKESPSEESDIDPHEPIVETIYGEVAQVAAGHIHSAALMKDGTVWTWGDNSFEGNTATYVVTEKHYSIKTDTRPETNKPVIKKADIKDVVAIEAGSFMTAAIKMDSSLWTWGYNIYGALGNGVDFATPNKEFKIDSKPYKILKNVESVSLGSSWGMALKKDGTLWTWGLNMHGNLGNGMKNGTHICKPAKIMNDVVAAGAGSYHGIALKKDGTVWVWGHNKNGQLGNSNNKIEYSPTPQKVMDDVIEVSAGYIHSSVVKKDGSLWTWGNIKDGRASKPTRYPLDENIDIEKIKDGDNCLLVLSKSKKLYTWDAESNSLYEMLDSVVQASMFSNHFLALKEDGSIWAWGNNSHSNLGDGTVHYADTPILVYNNSN